MNRFLDLNAKALPTQAANPLCIPNLNDSQVAEVFLVPFGLDPPDDWTNYDDWVALIDNQAVNGYRRIAGIGNVPKPQNYKASLPRLRGQRVNARGFQLTLNVIGLSDEHYNLAQQFQGGNISFRFWYSTVSGVVYGGDNGILPVFVDAITPLDEEGVERAEFTIDYTSDASPNRSAVAGAGTIVDVDESPRVWGEDENAIWGEDENTIWSFETT